MSAELTVGQLRTILGTIPKENDHLKVILADDNESTAYVAREAFVTIASFSNKKRSVGRPRNEERVNQVCFLIE